MRLLFSLFSTLFLLPFLPAQECPIQLSGQVLDKGTNIPLSYSNILLKERGKGVVTDSLGYFSLASLCPDDYHLEISHIGCESFHQFIKLTKDTSITIYLHHHAELLDEVVVHGHQEDNSTHNSSTIAREQIEQNSHKNLSDILESITGVSILKNGSGISKPIIQGLYGNRVAILNNGIAQAGQQWGNDHAPEIDPFIADHLSVVKGASALAYGGNSLGGLVMVETAKIKEDPHLHGAVNYIFQTNGLGNTLNAQIEKNNNWAAWRVSGTLKLQGDTRTPAYFLTNTGKREGNIALQLEKQITRKWRADFYASTFNTQIGILRGSHIGNLTDLETAIGRSEPFSIEEDFSYEIDAPRQQVNHHLVKLSSKYFISDHQVLSFQYGGQQNIRKEYDIRRGERRDKPALSLQQFSHFFEAVYQQEFASESLVKAGIQYHLADNANDPETDVFPLIPNYDAQTASAFLILKNAVNDLVYELGARYDYKFLEVVTFTQTRPIEIIRPNHTFHNYAFSGGLKYAFSEGLKTNFNVGYVLRAPEVNELYSFGLHQGVSGIEEGRADLSQEKSLKVLGSFDWYFNEKLFVQTLAYFQHIDDFIYLKPQNEFRLTIRGAFPVFFYEQTQAQIYGADLMLSYAPLDNLKWVFKYSKINGRDRTNDVGLINIPADNIYSTLTWSLKNWKKWEQNSIALQGRYIFHQNDITDDQDFLPPPPAYFILGLQLQTNLDLDDAHLRISVSAENLLNYTYRDYLNRLRYFADETGIDISLNLNYRF